MIQIAAQMRVLTIYGIEERAIIMELFGLDRKRMPRAAP
jgi:hypothetical protein